MTNEELVATLEQLHRLQSALKDWEDRLMPNFSHRYELIADAYLAEIARLESKLPKNFE